MFTHTPAVSWSTCVGAISSAFCEEVPTGGGPASRTVSRVTTAHLSKHVIPDKAAVICEILNIRMTDGWSVKSGHLDNTSSITSKQSCFGGGGGLNQPVLGWLGLVLTTSSQTRGFSHNVL
jgi:hypothetical protein